MKVHYSPTCGLYGTCGISTANLDQFTEHVDKVTCINCIRTEVSRAKRDALEADRAMAVWSERWRHLEYDRRGFRRVSNG